MRIQCSGILNGWESPDEKDPAPVLLSLAVCIWAADFWQTKPYTEWSEKEAQRIETNSPWSKQVPVSLGGEGGGGGGSGKNGRKTGGISEIDGSGGQRFCGKNGGIQEVGGGAGVGASLTITISWRTALVVRQAVAKEKFGTEAANSADAKKLIDEGQNSYAIMISGMPGRFLRGNDKMKESLLKNTSLIAKGKDPIQASDVQTGGNEQRAVLLFIFPKTVPLSLDDKEVEFATKVGAITVRQKFRLKDMVFNGKLDL